MSLSFYKKSEDFLIKLAQKIEEEDKNSIFDVDYSDGILDILVHATDQEYVINRHNANQKIWYSSPLTGADYFSLENDFWLNEKGIKLEEKLLEELKKFK